MNLFLRFLHCRSLSVKTFCYILLRIFSSGDEGRQFRADLILDVMLTSCKLFNIWKGSQIHPDDYNLIGKKFFKLFMPPVTSTLKSPLDLSSSVVARKKSHSSCVFYLFPCNFLYHFMLFFLLCP